MAIVERARRGIIDIMDDRQQPIAWLVYEHSPIYGSSCARLEIPFDSAMLNNYPVDWRPMDKHYFRFNQYVGSDICEQPSHQTDPPSTQIELDGLFPRKSVTLTEFQIPDTIRKELRKVKDPYMKATIETVIGKYL